MSGQQLLNRVKASVAVPYTAAGTTTITSIIYDMKGFDGIAFIAAFGTITATGTPGIKVSQSNDSGMSGAEDLAGTANLLNDTQGGKGVSCDIYRPTKRYVQLSATRAVANAIIGAVIGLQYSGRKQPESDDASIILKELFTSPAAGTP